MDKRAYLFLYLMKKAVYKPRERRESGRELSFEWSKFSFSVDGVGVVMVLSCTQPEV